MTPIIAEYAPLISETMPHIAHPQIRSRSTFGGTIAHADPAAELPAVSIALNVRFRLQSKSSDRWVPADEFFLGMFMTSLEPEEVLTAIEIPPMPPHSGYAFLEVSRQEGDYALVGVAATVVTDGMGKVRGCPARVYECRGSAGAVCAGGGGAQKGKSLHRNSLSQRLKRRRRR